MAINNEKKSNRLLGGRRYTSADLNTSQEAFTEVLDLRSSEIYTQGHLIPSSGLQFSGSSQSGTTYKVGGNDILKYWYRFRLTKSNVDEDAWFFISPTGSATGVTPQLIQSGQQTNFISPKYSISSLANANTEDTTPGYGVRVFASTSTNSGSLDGDDVVSSNDYQFDYKTGVLQFETARSSTEIVYMSAYQYVGTTLATGLSVDGDITANQFVVSSSVTYMTSSYMSGSTLFGDSTDDTHQFTGSVSVLGPQSWAGVTLNTSGSGAASGLQMTGSNFEFRANNPNNLFTLKNSSDEISVKIDDKVIVLGEPTSIPTAQAGGMYYSSSAWFLGYENAPT